MLKVFVWEAESSGSGEGIPPRTTSDMPRDNRFIVNVRAICACACVHVQSAKITKNSLLKYKKVKKAKKDVKKTSLC